MANVRRGARLEEGRRVPESLGYRTTKRGRPRSPQVFVGVAPASSAATAKGRLGKYTATSTRTDGRILLSDRCCLKATSAELPETAEPLFSGSHALPTAIRPALLGAKYVLSWVRLQ